MHKSIRVIGMFFVALMLSACATTSRTSSNDTARAAADAVSAADEAAAAAERWNAMDDDFDGVLNSLDKCPGSTPNSAVMQDGCPPVDVHSYNSVNFDTGSAALRPDAIAILNDKAEVVKRYGTIFAIHGHSDSCGSAATNMKLSEERARAVQVFLLSKGVLKEQISEVRWFGNTKPHVHSRRNQGVCNSESDRRVEFSPIP